MSAQTTVAECAPDEVQKFVGGLRVRCDSGFPDDAGAPAIRYFSVPIGDPSLYVQLDAFAQTAISGGARVMITYETAVPAVPNPVSECGNTDICRPALEVFLKRESPERSRDSYVMELEVDGRPRSALIYPSVNAGPAPVVFAFHGHGGTMWATEANRKLQDLWPEATIVYAHGLYQDADGLLSRRDDGTAETDFFNLSNVGPGWQLRFPYKAGPGVDFTNDLQYVDAIMARLEARHRIDLTRIYATGFSSGGFFTLSLIVHRPDLFTAFAPAAAYGRFDVTHTTGSPSRFNGRAVYAPLTAQPAGHVVRPVFYAYGTDDTGFEDDAGNERGVVAWDPETPENSLAARTVLDLAVLMGCQRTDIELTDGPMRLFKDDGSVVYWRLYNGGHRVPEEINREIVEFFRDTTRSSSPEFDEQECK